MSKSIAGLLLVFCCFSFCQFTHGDDKQGVARSSGDEDGEDEIVFENRNQKRQFERVLKRLQAMKPNGGGEVKEDDWFVFGGAIGDQVNFNIFQGEKNVARRVAEFISETRNKGQWKIYARAADSELATEQLEKVTSNHENWRQAEYNRMVANEVVRRQQIQNSYNEPYPSGRSYVTGFTYRPTFGSSTPVTSRNVSVGFGNTGMRSASGMQAG